MDQSLAREFLSKSDRHQFSPNDKNNDKIISNGKYFDLLWNSLKQFYLIENTDQWREFLLWIHVLKID